MLEIAPAATTAAELPLKNIRLLISLTATSRAGRVIHD